MEVNINTGKKELGGKRGTEHSESHQTIESRDLVFKLVKSKMQTGSMGRDDEWTARKEKGGQ